MLFSEGYFKEEVRKRLTDESLGSFSLSFHSSFGSSNEFLVLCLSSAVRLQSLNQVQQLNIFFR